MIARRWIASLIASVATAGCGVSREEHEALVARLTETRQRLEVANKAAIEAGERAVQAPAREEAWSRASAAIAAHAATAIRIERLARSRPIDCEKLMTLLDTGPSEEGRSNLARSLEQAQNVLGKNSVEPLRAKLLPALAPEAEDPAWEAVLAQDCQDKAGALSARIQEFQAITASSDTTPAPAEAGAR